MKAPVIIWFRRNLRVKDNAALLAASESGRPVIPVYVRDKQDSGGASCWWLHMSLASLAKSLSDRGHRLIVRSGNPETVLPDIVRESGARALYFTARYEPFARVQEDAIHDALEDDVGLHIFDDHLLNRPGAVMTKTGSPYKVFTPFWKASVRLGEPDLPKPEPKILPAYSGLLASLELGELNLLPTTLDWAQGLRTTWTPGEDGAHARLDEACEHAMGYAEYRNRPDLDRTSRLSPHLHFGEVSVRQIWHALRTSAEGSASSNGSDALLRQLYWRDFSAYLLFFFPDLPNEPLRPEFDHFPWSNNSRHIEAWQKGLTGYPFIDAGMRQLYASGWMHNRVRMVVASFLIKNLMVDWQTGAEWFLDTLVDADLANNSASWQWVAGSGADAAPYFRIFNPVLQGLKFDPNGDYIRRWVPELAKLPTEHLHQPWKADGLTQKLAETTIGMDYPLPIVHLGDTRQRALDAYKDVRSLLQSPAVSPGSSAG